MYVTPGSMIGEAAALPVTAVVARLKQLIVYFIFRFKLLRWWFAAEVRALVRLDKAGGGIRVFITSTGAGLLERAA